MTRGLGGRPGTSAQPTVAVQRGESGGKAGIPNDRVPAKASWGLGDSSEVPEAVGLLWASRVRGLRFSSQHSDVMCRLAQYRPRPGMATFFPWLGRRLRGCRSLGGLWLLGDRG